MDPNATLAGIRDILKHQRPRESAERLRELIDDADLIDDLLELIDDLDQWLSKGGFLPRAWQSPEERWKAAGGEQS